MKLNENIFDGITVECCSPGDPCVCPHNERVLRAYSAATPGLPPMTAAQRDWCLDNISEVEGYRRNDYESLQDPDVARGVLDAWTDYCRDKGLL